MITNQTIDGVSRELLERIAESGGYVPRRAELRALLDAPVPRRGEPVAILSGPDDSVCWTQDNTPKALRKQVVLIEHADLLRLQELAYGAAGMVYQTRWNRLGEWEEWKTVSLEQYQRSEGMLFERRIIYAEQPAPVAVVLPERKKWDGLRATACNLKGEAWNACLDELKRLNPSL